jgi:hypothetical protein
MQVLETNLARLEIWKEMLSMSVNVEHLANPIAQFSKTCILESHCLDRIHSVEFYFRQNPTESDEHWKGIRLCEQCRSVGDETEGDFCPGNELRLRLKVTFVVVEGETNVKGNFCGDNEMGIRLKVFFVVVISWDWDWRWILW